MLAPNTVLQNRYLVIRSIGQGGMGAVYLAKDQRLGNTVALKETFFTDARMRRAFEREARLLAHLRHPALPKVIDHFDEGDGQFLVMEFIAGDDLEVLLAQRDEPFDLQRVLRWADQLLDALEYLHTQETPILHRDIKPANLKLASRDQIILLDFGLAKGGAGQSTSVATSRSVLGYTPNFAPLEQIQGTGTDPRSDIYSLGATLYYLLTGVIPVNALNRATASVSELPDPLVRANEIDSRIPPAIADVLHQAVAMNPNRRPGTAANMREALIEASNSVATVDSRESKTLVMAPTADSVFPKKETEEVKSVESPLPTDPSHRPAFTEPVSPTIASTAPYALTGSPQHPSSYERAPQKPKRLPWIIGGIVALLFVGIAITFFVLNRDSTISNSNNTNEWQDTESNRRADQVAGVAARVNGKPIMLSEVDKRVSQQLEGKQSNLSPVELKQARLQMLENMIQQEVLYQRAEREKLLPTDAEIDQFIDTQMQQSQMTQEDFDKRLKETGQTKETLREETKRTLAIQKLQDRTSSKIAISDKEVDDYYSKNKEQFISKRGVDLAAIFADPADNGMRDDAKGDVEARQKIEQIYGQLQNGAQFEDVARAKSEDTNSNASGGDIGFATEAELKQNNFPARLIDDLLNKMVVGSYSAPVNFSNKWYIFKLKSRQLQEENLNLDSPGVRQRITDLLIKQRKELANAELLTTATNEAKIVNYLAASNTADQK